MYHVNLFLRQVNINIALLSRGYLIKPHTEDTKEEKITKREEVVFVRYIRVKLYA